MRKLTFELRSHIHQQNAIQAIQQILPDPTKPIVVTIQERNRSLQQNARLHAMLSEISKKTTYHGKVRGIDFWKGLFVSGWQIATNQHPEIVPGLEGEFINIRESTAKLSVKKLTEVMDYIEAYCAMNSIHLSEWRNYE
ncbi:TPA_asm: NinB protein [Salmonella enterica subsp. salamae serovar 48:d:z6]|uniref:NinB protein n=1 Tax=Salmonella enterica subsp. salamae serovar 48:d:z6 TaxID=1151170 RepID=A0A701XYV7_SALER|nr:NinB protein [Salmonella enterica subsp. salamae serovar 48:d:z6]HAE3249087.1 NinB protein [Salmonella enterica subsp. salamae serovar 48:d:z6]HAE7837017.1 NinB protein [Salmonella enterica subsp. salamae serovar 48:d:z6]